MSAHIVVFGPFNRVLQLTRTLAMRVSRKVPQTDKLVLWVLVLSIIDPP